MRFTIDEDIARAETLPAEVYRDPALLARMRERIFARSWQVVGDTTLAQGHVAPCSFLEGTIDEPLVLTRDDGGLHCLSNVCTHRGNLVATEAGASQGLRCRYHGRRFALDGKFLSMPEFEGAVGFPSRADDLPAVRHATFGPLVLAALDPFAPLEDLLAPIRERIGWLPFDRLRPADGRDYDVPAHFALYCDNYLEGFHIPFVHPALVQAIDYASYSTELFAWTSLQIGVAADGEDAFDPLDQGRRIAAYYFFVFPNLMFNFYPWGLSLNIVRPLAVDRTRVTFRSYVLDESRRGQGAGGALDRVELEDEAIVAQVQRGVQSRLYRRGRYSPSREQAVHHFHRLLARFLSE